MDNVFIGIIECFAINFGFIAINAKVGSWVVRLATVRRSVSTLTSFIETASEHRCFYSFSGVLIPPAWMKLKYPLN